MNLPTLKTVRNKVFAEWKSRAKRTSLTKRIGKRLTLFRNLSLRYFKKWKKITDDERRSTINANQTKLEV